jgi:hypothetical protein
MEMTRAEALEWVHDQMIVEEVRHDEVVAAYTALSGGAPAPGDSVSELFRRCCEIAFPAGSIRTRVEAAARPMRRKS